MQFATLNFILTNEFVFTKNLEESFYYSDLFLFFVFPQK